MSIRATICDDCPFRRSAAPGWLGANTPEGFVQEAQTDQGIACHLMMNQSLPRDEWVDAEAEAPRCRGAVTLMRNICKLPRDPDQAKAYREVSADQAKVFSRPQEFIDYHRRSPVRSWEFEENDEV